jgi:hypothetical protein
MKRKNYFVCDFVLFCLFSFYSGSQIFGQDNLNLSAGFGFPELLNIGLHYQLGQVNTGLRIGFLPVKDERSIAVSGDVSYHYGGSSKYTNIRPWYGEAGFAYLRGENESRLEKYWYLILGVGRDLNISERFGISIDGGLGVQMKHAVIDKVPQGSWQFNFEVPVMPVPGICFFWRI